MDASFYPPNKCLTPFLKKSPPVTYTNHCSNLLEKKNQQTKKRIEIIQVECLCVDELTLLGYLSLVLMTSNRQGKNISSSTFQLY